MLKALRKTDRWRKPIGPITVVAALVSCVFLPFPLGAGIGVLLVAIVARRHRRLLLALGGAVLLGLAGAWLLWVTRSPINRQNFDAIQVGWNEQEVEDLLGGPGNYARPGTKVLRGGLSRFYLPAEDYLDMQPDWRIWLSDDGMIFISIDDRGVVTDKRFGPVLSPNPFSSLRRVLGMQR